MSIKKTYKVLYAKGTAEKETNVVYINWFSSVYPSVCSCIPIIICNWLENWYSLLCAPEGNS